MGNSKLLIFTTALLVVFVAASPFVFAGSENADIVGMYHISEYHQYSMDDGELIVNHSGDGAYDSEFIEITSCSDGIFSGYCCVPMPGEKNPQHYPIIGTFDRQTGMIQYTCSYSYPTQGLFDWVQGTIKYGVMHLSGFTFGADDEYYASYQFTFVKEGYKDRYVPFEPMLKAGDRYSPFLVLSSINGDEDPTEPDSFSFHVALASDGLYYMNIDIPGSFAAIIVGAEIAEGMISGIGYDYNWNPFSLLISNQDGYIQINREYTSEGSPATWTAYLTKTGEPAPVKMVPQVNNVSFIGTSVLKNTADLNEKKEVKATLTTITNSLVSVTMGDSVSYGNIIPSGDGYVIAISQSFADSNGTVYYFGFAYIDGNGESLTYSGLYMSDDGELNAMYYKGTKN